MKPEANRPRPEIRRLWKHDHPTLVDHFQKLDPQSRRLRFGVAVSDEYINDYIAQILSIDTVIFGAFPDGELRGVAELCGLLDNWPWSAEIALSIEPLWQEEGLGDALLNRLIAAAQNRGIKKIHMQCLRENRRMQSLAKKHEAILQFDIGDVEATLDPPWPTPTSMFEEMFGDSRSYLNETFHLLE